MKWNPLPSDVESRLELELQSWKGTKYASGQRVKRVGVDCVRFVCGVLDNMSGTRTEFRSLPCDAHLHVPEKAKRAMLQIIRRYPHTRVENLTSVEPGDILVVGTQQAPGHAMIVGTRPNQIWHQDGTTVCWTSPRFGQTSTTKLYRIYRPNKGAW